MQYALNALSDVKHPGNPQVGPWLWEFASRRPAEPCATRLIHHQRGIHQSWIPGRHEWSRGADGRSVTKWDLQSKGHVDEGFIGLFLLHNLSNSQSMAYFYMGVDDSSWWNNDFMFWRPCLEGFITFVSSAVSCFNSFGTRLHILDGDCESGEQHRRLKTKSNKQGLEMRDFWRLNAFEGRLESQRMQCVSDVFKICSSLFCSRALLKRYMGWRLSKSEIISVQPFIIR